MTDNAILAVIFVCITTLSILTCGEPDILDATVNWIGRQP